MYNNETESLKSVLEDVFKNELPRTLQKFEYRLVLTPLNVDGKDLLSKGMYKMNTALTLSFRPFVNRFFSVCLYGNAAVTFCISEDSFRYISCLVRERERAEGDGIAVMWAPTASARDRDGSRAFLNGLRCTARHDGG